MRPRNHTIVMLAVVCVLLCSCEFETAESIITTPSEVDFGFTGTWTLVSEDVDDKDSELRIAMSEVNGVYNIYTPDDKEPWGKCRACQIGATKTALIEVDTNMGMGAAGQKSFYYAYAAVGDDGNLKIEQIDSEKLIALLKSTKTNSVIDRGLLRTEITADSEKFRNLILRNRSKILSDATIQLKTKELAK